MATMNFGRRVPVARVPTSAVQVETAIAELRAAQNLPPARVDPVYRAGAHAGAGALSDGGDDAAVTKAIEAGMKRGADRLRSGRPAACTYYVDLLELAQLDQIVDLSHPGLRAIGVGARLRTDDRGSRLVTVILLLGVPCQ